MRKAKILFASFDEVPSFKGATSHILGTFREIRRDVDVTLVTLGRQTLPSSSGIRHLALPIREANFLKRVEIFRKLLARIVAEEDFDVFHFRSPWEGAVLRRQGKPYVYEVNGLPSVELTETHALGSGLVEKIEAEEAACLRGASVIVSPSARTSRFISEKFGVESVRVIPNGYDPVRKHVERRSSERVRLAYVGTLHPWQGLLWALRAVRDVPVELHMYSPDHKLWMKHLTRRLRKWGLASRVVVHEPVAHELLLEELGTYDAGFSPLLKVPRNSSQGCFPIKNLDYLAAGIPVVASKIFVNQQILNDSNAIFFEPNRLSDLRRVLSELKPDRLEALRPSVRDSLRGHPTWNRYSVLIGEIYAELFSGPKTAPRIPSDRDFVHV